MKHVILSGYYSSGTNIVKNNLTTVHGYSSPPIFTTEPRNVRKEDDVVFVDTGQFNKKLNNGDFVYVERRGGYLIGYSRFIDFNNNNIIVVPTGGRVAYEELLRKNGEGDNIFTVFMDISQQDSEDYLSGLRYSVVNIHKILFEYSYIKKNEYGNVTEESPINVVNFINKLK